MHKSTRNTLMGLLVCVLFVGVSVIGAPALSYGTTFLPNSALSFQNEGTLQADHTALVTAVDNNWAAQPAGTVGNDYYATGVSINYFDALSLNFDLSPLGGHHVSSATLKFYAQKGSLWGSSPWEHYLVQEGAMNPEYQDSAPGTFAVDLCPDGELASNTTIGWVEQDIPVEWIIGNSLDVTLRLWNLRLDQVALDVRENPEPGTILLLLSGLFAMFPFKKGAFFKKS